MSIQMYSFMKENIIQLQKYQATHGSWASKKVLGLTLVLLPRTKMFWKKLLYSTTGLFLQKDNYEEDTATRAAACRLRAQSERALQDLDGTIISVQQDDQWRRQSSEGQPWAADPLTFQFLSNNTALMVGVVHDRRRGGRVESLLLQPPAMALLPRQHALLTFPLVQIIPSLSKIHVQAPSILLVSAGAQPDAIAWQ